MNDKYPQTIAEFENPKPLSTFSLIMNSNTELLNNLGAFENLDSNVEGLLVSSSTADIMSFLDHHQDQHQQLPMPNFTHHHDNNLHNSFHSGAPSYDPIYPSFLPSTEAPSRAPNHGKNISATAASKNNYSYGGKKRKRSNEREMEKPRDVVHVRAKRGQATDSHSLAERLRREKINEKLRCLQDLVPGCYKTMGMAVMLDVITTYVRSLQNQIEFLSMKLSAASLFYDFNSEMDAVNTMQGTNGYEAQGMDQRMVGEGYGGGGGGGGGGGEGAFSTYFPSSAWPPPFT